jgi:hypothetical protein
MQWLLGTDSLGIERQERGADHGSLCTASVKSRGAIHPLPNKTSWHGVQLIKHKENLPFYRSCLYRQVEEEVSNYGYYE